MPNRHTTKMRVLAAFQRQGPSTCDEIERRTGIPHQCASARVADLRRSGALRATGQTRKTRLGRPAMVLEVAHG